MNYNIDIEGNPLEIYAYYEKPLLYLCRNDDQEYLVYLYKSFTESDKWLCMYVDEKQKEKLFNTKISIRSFIETHSQLILLEDTEKRGERNSKVIKFKEIEKQFLPHKDIYLRNSKLFDIEIEANFKLVKELVLNSLLKNTYKKYYICLEEKYKLTQLIEEKKRIIDIILKKDKDQYIYVQVKYFIYSRNILNNLNNNIIEIINYYNKKLNIKKDGKNKFILFIIVKNQDKDYNIRNIYQNINEILKTYLQYINFEVNIQSIYSLVEKNIADMQNK